MTDPAREETQRQRDVVDLMASAHATLRDRYRRRATVMTCTLLAASVVATAFAFAAGDTKVTLLGVTLDRSAWLGWFAVATFTLTLADLVLDWRGNGRRHEDAVRQLAGLKAEYRRPLPAGAEAAARARLTGRYQSVMDTVAPIPERKFLALKAAHLRKSELSRLLSAKPGMSVRQARRALKKP
ncbi:hypothetical protein ACQPZX_28810 [Actinoplanes sp. CA-142083]|uniref:hypothetical protein n=1 Tax=Actinoplanes sp. CA-142083 TaxID=3239903 RepID=UPI003D93C9E7